MENNEAMATMLSTTNSMADYMKVMGYRISIMGQYLWIVLSFIGLLVVKYAQPTIEKTYKWLPFVLGVVMFGMFIWGIAGVMIYAFRISRTLKQMKREDKENGNV